MQLILMCNVMQEFHQWEFKLETPKTLIKQAKNKKIKKYKDKEKLCYHGNI